MTTSRTGAMNRVIRYVVVIPIVLTAFVAPLFISGWLLEWLFPFWWVTNLDQADMVAAFVSLPLYVAVLMGLHKLGRFSFFRDM